MDRHAAPMFRPCRSVVRSRGLYREAAAGDRRTL